MVMIVDGIRQEDSIVTLTDDGLEHKGQIIM